MTPRCSSLAASVGLSECLTDREDANAMATAATDIAKIRTSKNGSVNALAKGTRKSTNLIGNAIKKNLFFRENAATTHKKP